MKVLYIAAEPFFVIKGSSISIRNTLMALTEADYKVDFLGIPEGSYLELTGCTIYRTPRMPTRWLSAFLIPVWMFLQACWMCSRTRYDVVHVLMKAGWMGGWLKRFFGVKFIYDLGGNLLPRLQYPIKKKGNLFQQMLDGMMNRTLSKADLIRTVSAKLAVVLNNEQMAPVVIIEDAPLQISFQSDDEGASRLREEFGIGMEHVVVYTGSFAEDQGVEMLVRAARQVAQRFTHVRFLFVGGNPSEIDKMQYLADSLDMGERCLFAGIRPVQDIPAFMTLSGVLVSPRLSGGTSVTKLLTYMQSGKPIVATRIPAHTLLLDDSCAVLVRPQSENLAVGIMRVLQEPLIATGMGKDALARVAEHYSLSSFKHKIRRAYQDLLGNR